MINGTKLLSLAGMTRGRRDGMLKAEKTRHVVRLAPAHLKELWIPFERALEFAVIEGIVDKLYPLYVHDIGALLYHPSNHTRSSVTRDTEASKLPTQQPPLQRFSQCGYNSSANNAREDDSLMAPPLAKEISPDEFNRS
jgi:protein SOK2